jgi:hypothetical protein
MAGTVVVVTESSFISFRFISFRLVMRGPALAGHG